VLKKSIGGGFKNSFSAFLAALAKGLLLH
jgi:hypothetical protein